MNAADRNHRHGLTLVELLGLMPLIAVILVLSAAIVPSVLKEVPADRRATNTHRQITGLLQRIQQDMDAATALPDASSSEASTQADEQTLLIQTPGGLVCYTRNQNDVTRRLQGDQESPPQVWQMRDAVINWKRVIHDGQADTIEVHTAVLGHAEGGDVEHLTNNHLYFLNSLQSRLVRK